MNIPVYYMKKIVLLFILLLVSTSVSGFETEDYLTEFNNEGEQCVALDVFHFEQWEPTWWKNNRFVSRVPVYYQCCQDDDCTVIIIDISKGDLLKDVSFRELVDLNYIKYALSEGNLSENRFISEGLDTCYFHGKKEFSQETLNLVADSAEVIARTRKTKQAQQVITVIKTARSLELVSPVSLADLTFSAACTFNNKKLEKAMETLASCNQYLRNINNNYAQSGYVYGLNNCFIEARSQLLHYREGWFAKLKHGSDLFFNFWRDLSTRPLDMFSEGITDTEYDLAGVIEEKIKNEQLFLHHPKKESIFNKYATRILQKKSRLSNSK
jgi:hypothetical protein